MNSNQVEYFLKRGQTEREREIDRKRKREKERKKERYHIAKG